jgi:hypothetical protein
MEAIKKTVSWPFQFDRIASSEPDVEGIFLQFSLESQGSRKINECFINLHFILFSQCYKIQWLFPAFSMQWIDESLKKNSKSG